MTNFNASLSVNITGFKKNPMALLKKTKGKPIAILNRDICVAYLIPAKTYKKMLDILEDYELYEIIKQRQKQINNAIAVTLENL